jgi:ABC-2 type transport system permease protein
MLEDTRTVLWKELKEFQAQGGRGKLGKITMVMAFVPGLILPLQFGRSWVETPVALLTLTLVPVIVLSVVADTIAGERERHTLETLLASRLPDRAILFGKIGAATTYAMTQLLLFILPALLIVNIIFGRGDLLVYPLPVWLGIFALGPLLAVLISGIGVLISMRAQTVRQAQLIVMTVMFLSFLIGPILLGTVVFAGVYLLTASTSARDLQELSEIARRAGLLGGIIVATCILIVVDTVVVAFVQSRFRRTKLALD